MRITASLSTSVAIRRAERADAPALLQLIVALAQFEKLPAPDLEAQQRLIEDGFGAHPRFQCWLAFCGETPEPVAYAFLFETYSSFLARPTLYLEDIFVLPAFRRRGIGTALLRHCIQLAHERGCGRMEWTCLDWNTKAQAAYHQLGARQMNECSSIDSLATPWRKPWIPHSSDRFAQHDCSGPFNQPMKIITDERCTGYSSPGHPERPARISKTLERLRNQKELSFAWAEPLPVTEESLLRAHSPAHLARVKEAAEDLDADTPAHPSIFEHASRSVGGALQALSAARAGEAAFNLMRPPGHHATRDRAMGFCYLNSIAITVLEALATGVASAAVFDFDVHHGNGTEAILLNHPLTAFFSIHQHPCYPGTGTRDVGNNCFNFPVAPQTPREEYRKTLSKALEQLKQFKPALLAVSAGFDAYARDPLAQETLEANDYHWLGQSIRALGIPTFSLLEGGYSTDLPELILAYLRGIDGK